MVFQICKHTIFLLLIFFLFKKFLILIYFWLCGVFTAAQGLSLVAASGAYSSLQPMGFSRLWLLLLQSTGSGVQASGVVVRGLSCSAACGIFPEQGPNPCPLHWQANSWPLDHKGSPFFSFSNWGVVVYNITLVSDV